MFRPADHQALSQIHLNCDTLECRNASNIDTENLQTVDNNYIITDKTTILDVLGWHFEKVNAKKTNDPDNRLTNIIDATYKTLTDEIEHRENDHMTITHFTDTLPAIGPKPSPDPNMFYSTLDTYNITKHIKNKTSTGIDKIPNIALKNLPIDYIKNYKIIFNNIINNCYYPERWNTAKILPILKKDKNPLDPASYRPISLLPNISKIFEALINTTITAHCNKNKIIPDEQYGFRHNHSTIHAINKFLTDTTKHLNNHEMVAAGLIDLEKAFDSVWLKGLMFKLVKKGFPRYLTCLLWKMTQNRQFFTASLNAQSLKNFKIEEGLQQGTVNSPILFNIYNSDTLNLFDLNNNNNTYSIAFADDLLIYCWGKYPEPTQTKLEVIANKINKYYEQWHLKINAKKITN